MTRQRAYQLARRAKGLCQECGRTPSTKTMCERCLAKLRLAMRERYQIRRSLGLCVYCGEQPASEGVACFACRERVRTRGRGPRAARQPGRAHRTPVVVWVDSLLPGAAENQAPIFVGSAAPAGRV